MELITVQKMETASGTVNAVNARDLHASLEIKTEFRIWINRAIEKYSFEDGLDFQGVQNRTASGQTQKDYIVTLDMAKELCMLDDSSKGREFRKYFIECEKRVTAFKLPQTLSEALYLAAKQAEQIEQQQKLIELQKPKADFYDAVTGSKDTIDISTVAKVLNIKGLGRNKLFELLRDKKVLMQNNQPMQSFCDRGYFRVIETKYNKPDGSTHINTKTVVYQKGLDYIRKICNG